MARAMMPLVTLLSLWWAVEVPTQLQILATAVTGIGCAISACGQVTYTDILAVMCKEHCDVHEQSAEVCFLVTGTAQDTQVYSRHCLPPSLICLLCIRFTKLFSLPDIHPYNRASFFTPSWGPDKAGRWHFIRSIL